MKKFAAFIAFGLLLGITAKAQTETEITPFGGYVFDASFNVQNGKAKILASPDYGLHLSFPLRYEDGQIEFTYERQDTKIRTNGTDATGMNISDTIPVSINYFLIGGVFEEYRKPHHVIPFGGVQLGAGIIAGKEDYGSVVPFSFAFKAGLKYFINDRIGFRLQAQMNIMVIFEGSDLYCGVSTSGSGCGFIVTATSSTGQFGLGGGLVFKLAKAKKKEASPQKDLF
ncbi:MAG: hypothetical protein ABI723_08170 [Bacteroidia bacterium]